MNNVPVKCNMLDSTLSLRYIQEFSVIIWSSDLIWITIIYYQVWVDLAHVCQVAGCRSKVPIKNISWLIKYVSTHTTDWTHWLIRPNTNRGYQVLASEIINKSKTVKEMEYRILNFLSLKSSHQNVCFISSKV